MGLSLELKKILLEFHIELLEAASKLIGSTYNHMVIQSKWCCWITFV